MCVMKRSGCINKQCQVCGFSLQTLLGEGSLSGSLQVNELVP